MYSVGIQPSLSCHLLWKDSPITLKGKFSLDWILGKLSFIFLAVIQEALEISAGIIASPFLCFSNFSEAFLV